MDVVGPVVSMGSYFGVGPPLPMRAPEQLTPEQLRQRRRRRGCRWAACPCGNAVHVESMEQWLRCPVGGVKKMSPAGG